jgi:hypothetical protein
VALVKTSRELFFGTWGSDMVELNGVNLVELNGVMCSMRRVGLGPSIDNLNIGLELFP